MRTLSLLILLVLITSCSAIREGVIKRNCELAVDLCLEEISVDTVETIRIDTTYIDRIDTVFIRIVPDTVVVSDTVIVEKETGLIYSDTIRAEVQFAKAHAYVFASRQFLELTQKDSLIEREIRMEEMRILFERLRIIDRTAVIERTWWQKFKDNLHLWGLIIVLALAYIDLRISNKK